MSSLYWKRIIAKIFPSPVIKARKIILLYHSVGHSPWAISSEVFDEQIQFLHDHCELLSLSDLLISKPADKIQVAITFDDGYACLYDNAAPVLRKYNATATVYLNTGWIADEDSMRTTSDETLGHYPNEHFLTWPEVKALSDSGWGMGSHGVDHLDLTLKSTEISEKELRDSKKTIENHLGKSCTHFAYTWGKHSDTLKTLVSEVGYLYAASAHHAPLNAMSNGFSLPRMNIATNYSFDDFKNIVLGKWDFIHLIQNIRKRLKR